MEVKMTPLFLLMRCITLPKILELNLLVRVAVLSLEQLLEMRPLWNQ
jgi:hypothetical protein